MSHVADGDLHAYLDGALSLYPEEEAHRIREHLEQCAECNHRLREEEDLRDRATKVLSRTDSGPIEPPPFEEVRRIAEVRSRRPSPSRSSTFGGRLGWAASVALALGTGWVLGRSPEATLRPSVAQGPSAAAEQESLPEDDAVAVASGDAGPGQEVSAAPDAAEAFEARVREEVGAPAPVDEDRRDRMVAASSIEPALEAEDLAGQGGSREALTDQVARVAGRAAALAPTEVPVETVKVAGEPAAAAFEDAAAEAGISASPEVAGLPANMLVPGLPVVEVRWVEWSPGVSGLLVRQRLVQDTVTLELRFAGLDGEMPDTEPPGLFGPVPEGLRQAIRSLGDGRGWVALRGPLDQPRLERLLELLQ